MDFNNNHSLTVTKPTYFVNSSISKDWFEKKMIALLDCQGLNNVHCMRQMCL